MFFKRTEPALVLRKFQIDTSPSATQNIKISGRTPGLMAWLLTLVKIDADASLSVNRDRVDYKTSSLFGQDTFCVPISKVSSTSCGFRKPFHFLVLGVLSVLAGLFAGIAQNSFAVFLIMALVGLAFVAVYFLKKTIYISVQSSGSINLGIKFKRSVVENVDVNIEKAKEAVAILNHLISDPKKLPVVKPVTKVSAKRKIPAGQLPMKKVVPIAT